MKFFLILLIFLIFNSICFSQFNPISQILYGDDLLKIGYTISINGSGNRIALVQEGGHPDSNTYVKVYDLIDNDWYQVGEDIQITTNLLNSSSEIALNEEGNRFIVGTSKFNYPHFLKVYELLSNEWVQMGNDIVSEFIDDGIGGSLDINSIGDIIIFGGGNEEYSKVLKYENDEWLQLGQTLLGDNGGDKFGLSVSINSSGNIIAVAAPLNDENGTNSGKLNLYEFANDQWTLLGNSIYGVQGDLMGLGNGPGTSGINLNREGNVISMGSYYHQNSQGERVGMVMVYELINSTWVQRGQTIEGENIEGYFGGSHSMNSSGEILAIGDFFGTIGEKVVVYSFENDSWSTFASVLPELENFCGFSLAINDEGNILAVGAPDDGAFQPSEARLYEFNGILDVDNNKLTETIHLAPNPNNGSFSLNFTESKYNVIITISEISGKVLFSELYKTLNKIEIDKTLDSGIYFVNIKTNSSEATLKMIVQ